MMNNISHGSQEHKNIFKDDKMELTGPELASHCTVPGALSNILLLSLPMFSMLISSKPLLNYFLFSEPSFLDHSKSSSTH